MREWRLIRRRNSEVVHVEYSVTEPEINRAFGEPALFRWESRLLSDEEWTEIQMTRRRARYPEFDLFLEAYFAQVVDGNNQPMTRLLARVNQIHNNFPLPGR